MPTDMPYRKRYDVRVTALLDDLLDLATTVVVAAGNAAAETAQASRAPISTKASQTDFVTAADRAVEAYISEHVLAARPDDSFLGEEGARASGMSGVRWIVDPIDGTVNFSYGMPGFCTSIAAEVDGVVSIGTVFDPLRNELFSAQLGLGAFLNGNRISRSAVTVPLAEAVVGTGFDYRAERRREQALQLVHVLPNIGDIRRIGSAALEMCWVACNRLDAYFESGTKTWDRAAGALIASEAGAEVHMLDSTHSESDSIVLVAAPSLSSGLLNLVSRTFEH